MYKKRKDKIIGTIIHTTWISLLFGLLSYYFIAGYIMHVEFTDYGKYTIGQISDYEKVTLEVTYKYYFYVNNQKYTGEIIHSLMPKQRPHIDRNFRVIYSKRKPEINFLLIHREVKTHNDSVTTMNLAVKSNHFSTWDMQPRLAHEILSIE